MYNFPFVKTKKPFLKPKILFVKCKGLCTLSPFLSSEIAARQKKKSTSCCVDHVYTPSPKLSSVIKKFGSGSI